jgi:hypothetical protein
MEKKVRQAFLITLPATSLRKNPSQPLTGGSQNSSACPNKNGNGISKKDTVVNPCELQKED